MTRLPTMAELWALMQMTFRSPRDGAAEVLRQTPPREALWLLFALVLVLTVITAEVTTLMAAAAIEAPDGAEAAPRMSILTVLALQMGTFFMMVLTMYHVGRYFGGSGSLDGTVMLVTWLQFILVVVQFVQIFAFLLMPFAAALIAVLAVALFLWLLVHFVAELHGFSSLPKVTMGVMGTLVAVVMCAAILAGIFGIELQTELANEL